MKNLVLLDNIYKSTFQLRTAYFKVTARSPVTYYLYAIESVNIDVEIESISVFYSVFLCFVFAGSWTGHFDAGSVSWL